MGVMIKVYELPKDKDELALDMAGHRFFVVCRELARFLEGRIEDDKRVKPTARKAYNAALQKLLDELDNRGLSLDMVE